ncbi:MAG: glycosyltransferase family 2 protein [Luteimonas sp.]
MRDFIDLTVEPLTQVALADASIPDVWRAYGSDPSFLCHWPLPGTLAGGWYEVDVDVVVHRGALHAPCFYPDYRIGYIAEADKITLGLDHMRKGAHRLHTLVRFHKEVSGLRFDPSVLPSEFTLKGFRIRRLGRAQVVWFMLSALLDRHTGMAKLTLLANTASNLLTGGPRQMADRLYHKYASVHDVTVVSNYAVWLDFYDDVSPDSLALARVELTDLATTPTISVVMPVYNTAERWLRTCIDSVIAQIYPHWELCIADDASTASHVRPVLEEYARCDPRIKVIFREKNGHISNASNSALELAAGDYVALLDHDDALHPLALLECAKAFEAHPRWRMLFTDEDKIDETGVRSDPYFKSDWNPDLFLSQNCVCHLSVYARDLVESAGGFRAGYEGAQDWDLTLRITARLDAGEIGHVPKVLYHWRMIEGSTALAAGEKTYAHTAAVRAIQSHLDSTGKAARVMEMPGYSGYYRIGYKLPAPEPLVSVLIPTRDGVDLLRQCIDSILEKTDYSNFEILILDNASCKSETLDYFESLAGHAKVRVAAYDHPFNFSAINNFGAGLARGELLALLNNDIEVISPGWLSEMVAHALRPEIGAVGAMLYYPNNTIQHAGVILGIGGVAGHAYVGGWRGYAGDKHRAGLVQNLSAVTAACVVVRADVFNQVGGLDEQLTVAFNDIDFCLRVREAGYRNLWTPFAELYHHESATRGYETTPEKIARFKDEERFMKDRWGQMLQEDPYYNPNFALDMSPFSLAFPPRSWNGMTGVRRQP